MMKRVGAALRDAADGSATAPPCWSLHGGAAKAGCRRAARLARGHRGDARRSRQLPIEPSCDSRRRRGWQLRAHNV